VSAPGRVIPAMAVVAFTVAIAAAPHAARADGDNPLDRARRVAENLNYTGHMDVRWVDQWGTPQQISFQVWGGDGVLQLGEDDRTRLAATGGERWLYENGQWDLVASPGMLGQGPSAAKKYRFVAVDGKQVAGRVTNGFGLVSGGVTRERLYFDDGSGMLLAREQLDDQGSVLRSASFSQIAFGVRGPRPPVASTDARPKTLAKPGSQYEAPNELTGGYERVEILRRPTAVQVVYSDGVHSLSVFEQPGRLDRKALPGQGRPVGLGRQAALQLAWPGGQIVVWQGGAMTYTVVGDGDADDVLAAARSVPSPRPSTWQRVQSKSAGILRDVGGR
jgi:hypothetical protein